MNTYAEKVNAALVGKKIVKADVSGFGATLWFDDGTYLNYDATDGGYSTFGIHEGRPE